MTNTNPFIKEVTRRWVTNGEKILAGGTTLKISGAKNNFLHITLTNAATRSFDSVGIGLPSLRELADTLTEICDVMEGIK